MCTVRPALCVGVVVCVYWGFELGIFDLTIFKPWSLTYYFVGLVQITYVNYLNLLSWKNPCFLCMFSGQASTPIFQHFITILRDTRVTPNLLCLTLEHKTIISRTAWFVPQSYCPHPTKQAKGIYFYVRGRYNHLPADKR